MDFNIVGESGNAVLQTIQASEKGRAWRLVQKREQMQKSLLEAKSQINNDNKRNNKMVVFSNRSNMDYLEEKFKEETIGLVSAAAFREKRQKLNDVLNDVHQASEGQHNAAKVAVRKEKLVKSKLSFTNDEDDEEDDDDEADNSTNDESAYNNYDSNNDYGNTIPSNSSSSGSGGLIKARKGRYLGKDPTVNTQFLSDPEREERMRDEKERLTKEYYLVQEQMQKEMLEVTYSYWDGTGHRRVIRISKGTSILQFLDKCRLDLESDFSELRSVGADGLMYVKEDLILPHSITFYELIKTKARGKSGPLFYFDVHEDVRLINDSRLEKDESHAGKIVDKKWYERNKHIFPASRWEQYDPKKTYNKYTIHGMEDYSKTL